MNNVDIVYINEINSYENKRFKHIQIKCKKKTKKN